MPGATTAFLLRSVVSTSAWCSRAPLWKVAEVVIWLQTLCNLGVIIPLDILFPMYTSAIVTLNPDTSDSKGSLSIEQEEDIVKGVQILTCMLDVLIVQLQIQVR